jgi:2-methylcitrate dehydratase PrpD
MIFNTDFALEDFILNCEWDDFPENIKSRAVVCAIDLTTALLLGSHGQQYKIGVTLAEKLYVPGETPVVGSNLRLSFMGAVISMAHAANSFDIDDGHNMIKGHPGASFVGGVLAAALDRNIGYKDYLAALIVSYEVTIRWALAMQDHYKFMHSTGAYGSFGTAAGVGRIFRFSREILNNALSIADFHAPMTPVMRAVEYPSMNKDGVPFGTMVGAMAALEAEAGYRGKTHLLEMPNYRYLLDTLGERYEISNLYFKPFTCCRWAHQPISACLSVMRKHGFNFDEIEKISVHTFDAAARLSKIEPKTTDEAQYNIAYPIAAAIVHGDLGYPQIRDEALGDQRVLNIM